MQKYTCPMHPQVIRNEPGNCPLCGMALVPLTQKTHAHHSGKHAGHPSAHDKHAGHATGDFLRRFWVCLVLTVPVLLLSHMIRRWLGLHFSFPGENQVLLALGTIVYVYGGMPFFKGLWGETKARAWGMMTLVALAISVAYIYSAAVVLGLPGMDFFWELATLIDIMLLGHWLEMRSQMAASRALKSLVELLPNEVTVERAGQTLTIGLDALQNGDTVIIKPGEKIPADGTVSEGFSYVNESMLTGESTPVKKEAGTRVIAGAINGDGALRITATGVGTDTYLNRVINLVQEAQETKSRTQNLADRVAKWLTLVAIVTGVSTLVYWVAATGDWAFSLERMVTVMVTACPHALGVAIPLVVAISTTLSATNGLLIRNRSAFEMARHLDTVLFDKTGTLTQGSHTVRQVIPLDGAYNAEDILRYAAALQQHSEHHIAKGVMRELSQKGLPLWPSTDFRYMQGMGVTGTVNGKRVVAAGPNYFRQKNIRVPAVPPQVDQATETVNFVLVDDKPAGIITLADSLREGSKETVESLKRMGIKVYLITGDNEAVARSVAGNLGMDGFLANVLPHQKQEKVKEFQQKGDIVAMTGDGVNDAPALARADVGIAIGSGTDVAAETADIILVNSAPRDLVTLIGFSKRTYRKMIQNLVWAVGYNVVAIPLAAGILYPHFMLSPALGAVLMSASTVVVAINAGLLKMGK